MIPRRNARPPRAFITVRTPHMPLQVGTIAQLAVAGWQIDEGPALGVLGGWPAIFYLNAAIGVCFARGSAGPPFPAIIASRPS